MGETRKPAITKPCAGPDIVVMVHPDYQYDPRLVTAMAAMVASGVYDAVLGSRIGSAKHGGMPIWKYIANRSLTAVENLLLGIKLTEFHTGYRAFSRKVLHGLPLLANSDDFVFDNQMIAELAAFKFRIGEISCPTKYFSDASSMNFRRSATHGSGPPHQPQYRLWKWGVAEPKIFTDNPASRIDSRDAETRHTESVVEWAALKLRFCAHEIQFPSFAVAFCSFCFSSLSICLKSAFV